MPTIRVGEINLYYEVHGEGTPLLLIMGLGVDLTFWSMQVPVFSKEYQVIAFDNRGVGRTDAPDILYTIEMMADDTAGLLKALGIEEAHILGYSMGGMIAQELAIKYPRLVKSLILAATAPRKPQAAQRARHYFETRIRMAEEGVSPESLVRNSLPWLFSERFFHDGENVETIVRQWLDPRYPQPEYAYVRQVEAIWGEEMLDNIEEIDVPTLVLIGSEDLLLPVDLSEELAKLIPDAELVVLEGGGHVMCYETPDVFNKAVLDFLRNPGKG